jgi:hypothetical protein
MKRSFVVSLTALLAAVVLLSSCEQAPQTEIDAANAAVAEAKAAEADRYLPAEFTAVQDSLNSALAAVETMNSKFALFRKYGESKAALAAVATQAAGLKEAAAAKKEEVRVAVQEALTAAQTSLQETTDLLAKAPRGKEGKAAVEAITNELAVVGTSLTEVTTLVNNGDYLTAQDKVNAATEKIASLKAEIEGAIAKTVR